MYQNNENNDYNNNNNEKQNINHTNISNNLNFKLSSNATKRILKQKAEIKNIINNESKAYTSWMNQFDKKFEIYLGRLSKI